MRPDISAKRDNTDLLSCSLFLLDMDGTLYLGDHVYEGAVDFIHTLEETGRDYIYLTNNSSRAGTDYITRLRKLGFPCEERNVFTSGMATGAYLRDNFPGRPVYVLGTAAFHRELRSYGVNVINDPGDTRDIRGEKDAAIVCAGFDTELVYAELDLAVHFLCFRKGDRGNVFSIHSADLQSLQAVATHGQDLAVDHGACFIGECVNVQIFHFCFLPFVVMDSSSTTKGFSM